jgi:glycine/D-amino acid oxidase-like deaminating enzyme
MTQTRIPVGLPRQNPTKSCWQTTPLLIADHRTTRTPPSKTTYAIIGPGITGTAIAYKLLQERPNASIVILEARQASSGATGRNGGHCRVRRYLDFKNYLEAFGKEESLKLEVLGEENVVNLGELVKELGIESI